MRQLSRQGLLPLVVRETEASKPSGRTSRSTAVMLEGLAALADGGVPLHQALRIAARGTRGGLREAMERIEGRVRDGASLSQAMTQEPAIFSAVTVGLIRAGERGAGLKDALASASEHGSAQAELISNVRSALTYPLVLLTAGTASVVLVITVVVPRFLSVLGGARADLPPLSRLLFTGSEFIGSYGLMLGVVGTAAVLAVAALIRGQRLRVHRWLLRAPVIGGLRHGIATTRCASTMGSLLRSGTPALLALDLAREAVADLAIAGRLAEARARIANGAPVSESFAAAQVLTPAALDLIAVGEQSGRLSQLLIRAGELAQRDVSRQMRDLVSLIEPALVLLFAAVVALVAAGILQALYSLRPG